MLFSVGVLNGLLFWLTPNIRLDLSARFLDETLWYGILGKGTTIYNFVARPELQSTPRRDNLLYLGPHHKQGPLHYTCSITFLGGSNIIPEHGSDD
jgi:hypothetical protein